MTQHTPKRQGVGHDPMLGDSYAAGAGRGTGRGAGQGMSQGVVHGDAAWWRCVATSIVVREGAQSLCTSSFQADDMADCEQRRRLLALAGIAIVLRISEKRKREKDDEEDAPPKREHRWWVRPWIIDKSLPECNTVYKLQLELEKVRI